MKDELISRTRQLGDRRRVVGGVVLLLIVATVVIVPQLLNTARTADLRRHSHDQPPTTQVQPSDDAVRPPSPTP
jgi:hypothetical protein